MHLVGILENHMIAEEKKIWKIREQLEDLTEENYKQFNEKLLPGVKHIIGVRLPALRKIAKETAKSNYSEYLNEAGTMLGEASYHEEFMVWGLVIAYIKADRSEVERHLDEFVPKINNWAVCDSCVTSYKFMQKESDFWFDYVKKYAESKNEFELRFMIVSLMSHFLDKEHIDEILTICGKIDHDKDRYFKSVRRKMLYLDENGHRVLQDTDNSTDDFNTECIPSLIEEQNTAISADGRKAETLTYDGVQPVEE